MPRVREALLHADAALLQHVLDLARVGEVGLQHDLAGQLGQLADVLGQSARADDELRSQGSGVGLALVDLGEEREVAQLAVDERVQLGGGMSCGSQLAQHEAQNGHVR